MSDPYLDVIRPPSGIKGKMRRIRWVLGMPLSYTVTITPLMRRLAAVRRWFVGEEHADDRAA